MTKNDENTIDRRSAENHWRWLQRGRVGVGGLDVADFDARGVRGSMARN